MSGLNYGAASMGYGGVASALGFGGGAAGGAGIGMAAMDVGAYSASSMAGVAAAGFAMTATAQAEPLWPGGPDIPGVPAIIQPPPPAPVYAPCTAAKTRACDVENA